MKKSKLGILVLMLMVVIVFHPTTAAAESHLPAGVQMAGKTLENLGRAVVWACGWIMKSVGIDVNPDDAWK
jgi:hypothetical protein